MYGAIIAQILYELALVDDTTYYHSLRVGYLMDAFAADEEGQKCLKQVWVTRDEFVVAGLLHDIGKTTWPRDILLSNKLIKDMDDESMLKAAKYRLEHPIVSKQILMNYYQSTGNRFWQRIATGVGAHHEDYDGRGYPRRLKGSDIPLLGRVLNVFSDFEARTMMRRYRNAQSKEQALAEMEKLLGQIYDPYWGVVVLNFLRKEEGKPDLDVWFQKEIKRLS